VARARAFLAPPPTVFRLNPRVPDALDRARQAGLEPRALIVPGAFEATAGRAIELASTGVLYLQDQGSQLVAQLAASPGRILDACAAPGGKTTLLADGVPSPALVVAAEASPRRLQTLATLVRRWGSPRVCCVGADGTRPPFLSATFDAVLLDAPCTGLGTLARHPDIRWRAGPEDLPRHAQRQKTLLESVAALVAPGGRLVYSTCSAEPEENEDIVLPFLRGHSGFATAVPPDWATPFRDGAFLRTQPERDGGDAFFVAVLQRTARE
jgi:16S rRNA (cytosine967-C5)-methyltransferase